MTLTNSQVKNITGVMINYYHICHTELWYFAHNIQMEQESDLVALGKLTHEEHYTRDSKEIPVFAASREGNLLVEGHLQGGYLLHSIKLDRITPDGYVHEIKKSDRGEKAHIWQLKFYLWVLKQCGFGELNGILEFPKQRKRVEVSLCDDDEKLILQKVQEIREIVSRRTPSRAQKIDFCRKCSYRELCWC